MTLKRVWLPVGAYSGRGGDTVDIICVHDTEGILDLYDLGVFFDSGVQSSSHVGIDNRHQEIGEYVSRGNKAWTQCNANPYCVSVEQCAPSGAYLWSRSQWLAQGIMLDNVAQWIAEEARHFNIPIVKLNASQAQGGGRGVCGHYEHGSWGTGHYDPGSNYPWDVVIQSAKEYYGGSVPVPPQGPVNGVDYMQFAGLPGTWLSMQIDVCDDGTQVARGLGTNNKLYMSTRAAGAARFGGTVIIT